MKLYVGNIPRLANAEALEKWFARAGLRVEAVNLMQEGESEAAQGFAWVKIADEEFPPKALRHLTSCTFWGRPLVVQRAGGRSQRSSAHETGA